MLIQVGRSGEGNNALETALNAGRLDMAQWLVSTFGAGIAGLVSQGWTSQVRTQKLHTFACQSLNKEQLRFVVEDVGLPADSVVHGWSLVMRAVQNCKHEAAARVIDFIEAAVALGADPAKPNASGESPASKAKELGQSEVAATLEQLVAQPSSGPVRGGVEPAAKRQKYLLG